ncbi:MAG: O-acetyl-ADP-ribose deacetylase [Rhodospirillales bacterium]|nr:O-acetyl-ADP-ribose deacetylase [Rhodospirillales bacterium]
MTSDRGKIEIVEADITTLAVDAIVNAANDRLAPGGGVCGAIHRAAGPELAKACAAIGSCPTGEARITPGFKLPAKYVIHAVGPVWKGGSANEDELLAFCYRDSLWVAAENKLGSIAFPAISTGIYGFPALRAAGIAVRAVAQTLFRHPAFERVVFCCFGKESAELHRQALVALGEV